MKKIALFLAFFFTPFFYLSASADKNEIGIIDHWDDIYENTNFWIDDGWRRLQGNEYPLNGTYTHRWGTSTTSGSGTGGYSKIFRENVPVLQFSPSTENKFKFQLPSSVSIKDRQNSTKIWIGYIPCTYNSVLFRGSFYANAGDERASVSFLPTTAGLGKIRAFYGTSSHTEIPVTCDAVHSISIRMMAVGSSSRSLDFFLDGSLVASDTDVFFASAAQTNLMVIGTSTNYSYGVNGLDRPFYGELAHFISFPFSATNDDISAIHELLVDPLITVPPPPPPSFTSGWLTYGKAIYGSLLQKSEDKFYLYRTKIQQWSESSDSFSIVYDLNSTTTMKSSCVDYFFIPKQSNPVTINELSVHNSFISIKGSTPLPSTPFWYGIRCDDDEQRITSATSISAFDNYGEVLHYTPFEGDTTLIPITDFTCAEDIEIVTFFSDCDSFEGDLKIQSKYIIDGTGFDLPPVEKPDEETNLVAATIRALVDPTVSIFTDFFIDLKNFFFPFSSLVEGNEICFDNTQETICREVKYYPEITAFDKFFKGLFASVLAFFLIRHFFFR